MKRAGQVKFFIGTLLLVSGSCFAQNWSFELEPYMLASSVKGDVSIGRVTGVPVDVNFSDILETLDIGAMVHFEAHHKSGWGFMLDYGFMDLSDDISGQRGGIIDADIRQGVLEALLSRRIESGDSHIDYFAGIRWWDNDIDVTIDPAILPGSVTLGVEADWIDLVIGARWTKTLNENWKFFTRADFGGLGLESDFTSALAAGVNYQFNKTIALDLQYKALWVDYEEGTSGQPGFFQYDTVTHGPIIGLVFSF